MPRQTPETDEVRALETSEPLVQAPRRRIQRVRPGPVRETYFTLRLAPQELDELVQAAAQRGTKAGTLARELILAGLEHGESLEARVVALEQALRELKQRVVA